MARRHWHSGHADGKLRSRARCGARPESSPPLPPTALSYGCGGWRSHRWPVRTATRRPRPSPLGFLEAWSPPNRSGRPSEASPVTSGRRTRTSGSWPATTTPDVGWRSDETMQHRRRSPMRSSPPARSPVSTGRSKSRGAATSTRRARRAGARSRDLPEPDLLAPRTATKNAWRACRRGAARGIRTATRHRGKARPGVRNGGRPNPASGPGSRRDEHQPDERQTPTPG